MVGDEPRKPVAKIATSEGRMPENTRIPDPAEYADAVSQIRGPRVGDEHEEAVEWADYFEHWGETVGSPPFTQEAVVAALRGPKPFGRAASFRRPLPIQGDEQ